jgi:hypothetical protein
MMSGSFGWVNSPSKMCKSVRHTPHAPTLINTCPAPGFGVGTTFSLSGWRWASSTIAVILSGMLIRISLAL